MKLYLNDNSVCDLIRILKDAIEVDNLGVAVYLSIQIQDRLTAMIDSNESIQCEMKE